MTIIKYNLSSVSTDGADLQELPPAILNKSLRAKQTFLSGYTSAINRGLTDDEAYFLQHDRTIVFSITFKQVQQNLHKINPR